MARHARQPLSVVQDVNLLLFAAWEHGARHVALRPERDGIEISYLRADGHEQTEILSLPYQSTVDRLREMSARMGRVHVHMGGHQWCMDAVVPPTRHPDRVFLHLRPAE